MTLITFSWEVNGEPTNAFSVKFGDLRDDPVGGFGLRRTDDHEELVPAGTDFENPSPGVYSYELDDPEPGLRYEYWVTVVDEEHAPPTVLHYFADGSSGDDEGDGIIGSSLAITRSEIRRSLGRYLGYSRSPSDWDTTQVQDVNDCIRSGERNFYHPSPLPNETVAHVWSFLQPTLELELDPPYSDGTVEVEDGKATLDGGEWPAWAADGWLVVAGVRAEIESRDSNSVVTLKEEISGGVAAGSSYTVERWRYTLPSDFSAFSDPSLSFSPAESSQGFLVRHTGMGRIRSIRLHDAIAVREAPRWYAIEPTPVDQSRSQRFRLVLDTNPRGGGVLIGRYFSNPFAITDIAPYPLGGQPHAETLLESCLAAAELHVNGTIGPHHAKFSERLATSVRIDRQNTAPRNFGSLNTNRDRGDYQPLLERHWNRYVSYNHAVPGR